MEKRAEMAFEEAVEEVIEEHTRLGLPLHIWLDGKVVELFPARSPGPLLIATQSE